ncbi:MAG: exodeoxyribonuclease III, partial [Gammaproteobacteria bacterium]|nr:exodeoxyribonuclease III [Gammaproteobacteria bacterium]
EKVKYSWWSYRAGARERNVGWRIDYFFVSESLRKSIDQADILNDVLGSDHCPVQLDIKI